MTDGIVKFMKHFFASQSTGTLPYTYWTELNCILCIVASFCALVVGVVLFAQYFCFSYSHVLRSAFNDVFVAVVVIQVLQALQLLTFSVMTVYEGRKTHDHGMTYAMCNISASLHQFLDAAQQLLQIAFFIVLANSRRLTALEVIDDAEERTVWRWVDEEDHVYSSGRSSASFLTRPVADARPKSSVAGFGCLCRVFCCCRAPCDPHRQRTSGVAEARHTLLRITWKVYLAAFVYPSALLLLCWLVLSLAPGLAVAPDANPADSGSATGPSLYFTQSLAWCWIPSGADLPPPVSATQRAALVLLQVAAAYVSPFVFLLSAAYAYRALRQSSPSLLRDHPIVRWRIAVFCAYPMCVYAMGAVHRFVRVEGGGSALAAALSFLYPFAAAVNGGLFLCTEALLGAGAGDTGVRATTGFCGVVKAIACSTVSGLPPSPTARLAEGQRDGPNAPLLASPAAHLRPTPSAEGRRGF